MRRNPNEYRNGRDESACPYYTINKSFTPCCVINECQWSSSIFVVIERHRSIYNSKQVLDYFDAFPGWINFATPDNRTFSYFNQNLVCDYGYKRWKTGYC